LSLKSWEKCGTGAITDELKKVGAITDELKKKVGIKTICSDIKQSTGYNQT